MAAEIVHVLLPCQCMNMLHRHTDRLVEWVLWRQAANSLLAHAAVTYVTVAARTAMMAQLVTVHISYL